MSAKQFLLHENARDRIRRGVEKLAPAVKVTRGPRARTVLLERDCGAPQRVDSGVVVARSVELAPGKDAHAPGVPPERS